MICLNWAKLTVPLFSGSYMAMVQYVSSCVNSTPSFSRASLRSLTEMRPNFSLSKESKIWKHFWSRAWFAASSYLVSAMPKNYLIENNYEPI